MNSRMLVLWLAGGAGILLLYAAYKGKSPTTLLTAALTNTKAAAAAKAKATGPLGPTGSNPLPTTGGTVPDGTLTTPQGPQGPESFLSGGVTNVDGVFYTTDVYGNPVTQIDSAYNTSPATYIPPNVVA